MRQSRAKRSEDNSSNGFRRGDSFVYQKAAEKSSLVQPNGLGAEHLRLQNPFSSPGLMSPVERHTLGYDCMDESVEALYFWILDELEAEGWGVANC